MTKLDIWEDAVAEALDGTPAGAAFLDLSLDHRSQIAQELADTASRLAEDAMPHEPPESVELREMQRERERDNRERDAEKQELLHTIKRLRARVSELEFELRKATP